MGGKGTNYNKKHLVAFGLTLHSSLQSIFILSYNKKECFCIKALIYSSKLKNQHFYVEALPCINLIPLNSCINLRSSVPKQTRCHAGGSLCLFACCGVVLIGAIAVGTMLGLSSPMIPDIQRDTSKNAIHLSVTQASWFGVRRFTGTVW